MARNALQQMGTLWRSRGISVELKVRLLHTIIFPIATYMHELWAMTKDGEHRVDVFELGGTEEFSGCHVLYTGIETQSIGEVYHRRKGE